MMTLRYHVDWNRLEGRALVERTLRPDGLAVLLVTEAPDNPGPSVTNAAEFIATALRGRGWTWDFCVEHYDRTSFRSDEQRQTWDLCVFEWNAALDRFDHPRWQPCTATQFRGLIAGEWQPPDEWRQPWPDPHNGHRTWTCPIPLSTSDSWPQQAGSLFISHPIALQATRTLNHVETPASRPGRHRPAAQPPVRLRRVLGGVCATFADYYPIREEYQAHVVQQGDHHREPGG